MSKKENKRFSNSEREGAPKRSGKNRRDYADGSKKAVAPKRKQSQSAGKPSAGSRTQSRAQSRAQSRTQNSRAQSRVQSWAQNEERAMSFDHFDEGGLEIVAGRNPVLEVLRGERDVERVFIAKGTEGSISQIKAIAKEQGVIVDIVDKERINAMAPGEKHQGVVAKVSPYKYAEMEDIFAKAEASGEDPFFIILDEVTDPHNLGAIIRTAECVGAHGVIIPKRRACSLTQTVALSAAGAIESIPVVQVTNLARTIDELKTKGLWVVAVDMDGRTYYKEPLDGPLAIVIGNEGKGIGRLVKEKCDYCISIPMKGSINSLNASNAAAVVMYGIRRARDMR